MLSSHLLSLMAPSHGTRIIDVFVSSTMEELAEERRQAREVISSNRSLNPVMFEDFGAMPKGPREAYIGEERECDIVVGILGRDYSKAVDEEFMEAIARRIDLLVFLKNCERTSELQSLIERLKSSSAIVYASYGTLNEFSDKLDESLGNLLAERFSTKRSLGALTLPDLSRWTREYTLNAIKTLKGDFSDKLKKFVSELYAPRKEVEREIEKFLKSDKSVSVVVGPAGVGKTNLLCNLAEEASPESGSLVLFIWAAYIRTSIEDYIIDALQPAFPRNAGYNELQERITNILRGTGRSYVVLIDAINEAPDPEALKIDLANLASKTEGAVKIIASCRDIDWGFFARNNDRLTQSLYRPGTGEDSIQLGTFTDEELDQAWSSYQNVFDLRGHPSKLVLDICRHPLVLRFLAEGFEGDMVPPDIKRREIFDRYWNRKLGQTGCPDLAKDRIFKIVGVMLDKNLAELPLTRVTSMFGEDISDPKTPLSKVLSEQLIIYTRLDVVQGNVIGFAYEAFFEYVVALYILQVRWADIPRSGLLDKFKDVAVEARSSRAVRGAIEFLILFVEDQQDKLHLKFALAALESRQEDIEMVACSAVSKLDLLDDEALECLKQFALSDFVQTPLFAQEAFVQSHHRVPNLKATLDRWILDENDEVRALVAATISRLDTLGLLDKLRIARELSSDGSSMVRFFMTNSLVDLMLQSPTEVAEHLWVWHDHDGKAANELILRAISQTSPGDLPREYLQLVLDINKGHHALPLRVVAALGSVGVMDALASMKALQGLMDSGDTQTILDAAVIVGKIGRDHPEASLALLETAFDHVRTLKDPRFSELNAAWKIRQAAQSINIGIPAEDRKKGARKDLDGFVGELRKFEDMVSKRYYHKRLSF